MDIVTAVLLIICGIVAAGTLIVQKKPNAQDLLNKLTPYQAVIGVIVCLWGIWTIIRCMIYIRALVHFPVYLIVFLATGATEVLLGFLLGYSLIAKYALSGNVEAQTRGSAMQARLLAVQVPLGLVGIGLGVLLLILRFVIL